MPGPFPSPSHFSELLKMFKRIAAHNESILTVDILIVGFEKPE